MPGGPAPNKPLLIYQPQILAVMLVFYSPIFVALLVFSMSFIFQNFKGIVYLLWIIIFSWARTIIPSSDNPPSYEEVTNSGEINEICNMVLYSSNSNFGNSTFSMFFITFTMVYICGPMFVNKEINYWVLAAFLFYLVFDVMVRFYFGCINKLGAFLNIIMGLVAGGLTLTAMYAAKISNYLFFNEISSSKEICSMPSKQTFKCAVYKNGQLVGNTTT
jgi:hypothetical protein